MTLFSWDSHDAWLLLEADPTVKAFCERRAYVAGTSGRVLDFWVEQGGQSRFWMLSPDGSRDGALPKSADGVTLRILRPPDMIAFSMPIQNRAQIVPYRTSFIRHSDVRLRSDVFARLDKPHRLERIEAAFHPIDISVARAALFDLLAGALEALGFQIVREREHISMRRANADGTTTPLALPNHPSLSSSTLRAICVQVQMPREEFPSF